MPTNLQQPISEQPIQVNNDEVNAVAIDALTKRYAMTLRELVVWQLRCRELTTRIVTLEKLAYPEQVMDVPDFDGKEKSTVAEIGS